MRKTPLKRMSKKRKAEMPQMRKCHDIVFERDDNKCVKCVEENYANFDPENFFMRILEMHHIRQRNAYPEFKTDPKNNLCLCKHHHDGFFHKYPEAAKEWLRVNRPEQHAHLYGEFCPNCEDYREVEILTKDEKYIIHDRVIIVPVRAAHCCTCGERIGSDKEDQEILDAAYKKYEEMK